VPVAPARHPLGQSGTQGQAVLGRAECLPAGCGCAPEELGNVTFRLMVVDDCVHLVGVGHLTETISEMMGR
jgi:hypothetical protein